MWMSICKSPAETHVHCLFEEATRFMFTKLKRFKHAAHRLEKKTKKRMGRRLGKHSL